MLLLIRKNTPELVEQLLQLNYVKHRQYLESDPYLLVNKYGNEYFVSSKGDNLPSSCLECDSEKLFLELCKK